jgi:hypothetical protein
MTRSECDDPERIFTQERVDNDLSGGVQIFA